MKKKMAIQPWKLEVGGKVYLNGKPHEIVEKKAYRTTEEYESKKNYGGGVKYTLSDRYILIYENHFKEWKLVKVNENKGLFIQSTTWAPLKIKTMKFIKPNHVVIQMGKEIHLFREIFKKILKSTHKKE
jgi:hypothetical protein